MLIGLDWPQLAAKEERIKVKPTVTFIRAFLLIVVPDLIPLCCCCMVHLHCSNPWLDSYATTATRMYIQNAVKEILEQIKVHLKDKQIKAISRFCSGNDVFVSLPTGYGKSLIYALLPLIFDKIRGIVVN